MRTAIQDAVRNAACLRGMDALVLFKRWAVECFLRRLSDSKFGEDFVLKGSYLFAFWSGDVVRAATDLDLHYSGAEPTKQDVLEAISIIANSKIPVDDRAEFVFDRARISIFPPTSGQLVRASFPVQFGKTKFDIQIDVSIGELLTPGFEVAWYPSMLPGFDAFKLNCSTRETMIAEKLAVAVEFGADNTRVRDYYDLWFLITHFFFFSHSVHVALVRTLSTRKTCRRLLQNEAYWLAGFSESFSTQLNEKHWSLWFDQAHTRVVAPSFPEALSLIREFTQPILLAARGSHTFKGAWFPGQGWRTGRNCTTSTPIGQYPHTLP